MRTKAMIRFPTVLFVPKAVDIDGSGPAIPLGAADCTSAIALAALIVMLRAWVVVAAAASVTRTVKLVVPATVGVPEITPVPALSVSPAGSGPGATTDP